MTKKTDKPVPFFARFLEGQELEQVSGGGPHTSKKRDVVVTEKYPSDDDEFVTLKYPSDSEDTGTVDGM